MLVDTNQLISAKEFRKNLNEYITAAKNGHGPFAIAEDSEVVGFFISADEYEQMFGVAVKNLLDQRMTGKTISHSTVRRKVRAILDQHLGDK